MSARKFKELSGSTEVAGQGRGRAAGVAAIDAADRLPIGSSPVMPPDLSHISAPTSASRIGVRPAVARAAWWWRSAKGVCGD